ncbi:MAG: glycosyltransferase family 2 protein [Oscillospiraceae bacterium]|nr:glycosyltransferase family 2 protein [Oscillospiraceae bacterium]
MLISLVVPCYNEESSLPLLYEALTEVRKILTECRFELIFVDDGSKDGTLPALKKICDGDSDARYLSFSRNFGKEAAIFAGLSETRGDLVALLDADMQDPPSLIPEMLRLLKEGDYDVVATRRVDRKGEPKIRSFFARAFYRLINKMSDVEIVDGARDFRLMRRPVVDAVLDISERQRFSKGIFGWVGFKTHWLEYQNVERVAGETKWSFWKLFKYAIEGIIAFTTVPLRLATITGFIVSAAAFLYMLYYLIKALITQVWSSEPGYASTLVIILFLGGMILIALGILGEYMARTYMEVKNRPLYVVRERSGPDEPDKGKGGT